MATRPLSVTTPALAKERFISVTTFKRDGTPVSVPVWCAGENGTLLVFSEAKSWKVKRIRRDRHVRVAPCSARGKPHGPALDADATIAEDTKLVEALLAQKYRRVWPAYTRAMAVVRRLKHQAEPESVTIRITPRPGRPVLSAPASAPAGPVGSNAVITTAPRRGRHTGWNLKALVGSGDRIALFAAPFVVVGVTSMFSTTPGSRWAGRRPSCLGSRSSSWRSEWWSGCGRWG